MNYYISDLHLAHENAIWFDHRPFQDIDEMNTKIIENWNQTVSNSDTVYILGDLIWAKESQWPVWLAKLRGQKVLIRGNHDPKEFSAATKSFFQDITNLKEIVDSGKHVILCHYPIPFHRADFDPNFIMLYGHVHTTAEYEYLEKLRKEIRESHTYRHDPLGQFINVGCMMPWMNYTPQTLNEILKNEEPLDKQPVPSDTDIYE